MTETGKILQAILKHTVNEMKTDNGYYWEVIIDNEEIYIYKDKNDNFFIASPGGGSLGNLSNPEFVARLRGTIDAVKADRINHESTFTQRTC